MDLFPKCDVEVPVEGRTWVVPGLEALLAAFQLAPFGLFFSQNPRPDSPSSRIFSEKQPQNWLRWTWQSIPDRLLESMLFT